MAGNSKRDIVQLKSSAGTGYRYTVKKNKRLHGEVFNFGPNNTKNYKVLFVVKLMRK